MASTPPTSERDPQASRSSGLAAVMRPVNSVVERYIPSALVFAIVLTIVVAVMALTLTTRDRPTSSAPGATDCLACSPSSPRWR